MKERGRRNLCSDGGEVTGDAALLIHFMLRIDSGTHHLIEEVAWKHPYSYNYNSFASLSRSVTYWRRRDFLI